MSLNILRLAMAALIASSGLAVSAQATQSTAPVPLVAAPPSSPVVQPDGSVTFQLQMPNAQKVELNLEGHAGTTPMTKDASGDWSVNISGLAPEYYSFSYNVDGTHVLDPRNFTIKTSFFQNDNVFLVPGITSPSHRPMPWELVDVPHGIIHHHYYRSNIVIGLKDNISQYYVYTPPGFDPRAAKKYPVLYLLHGYSDEPSAWTMMGKANLILDNLIAAGKAKPMIVVMPWGYGDMGVITQGWASWRNPALVQSNFGKFSDALLQEVVPMVAKQYPLAESRDDHAIAGLSMGGAETLLVGLNHTDYFASIGAFSAGGIGGANFEPLFPSITTQTGAGIQSKLKVFWIACGTEDGLNQPNQNFIVWLQSKGMTPTAIHTPGMHAWMVWRDNLSNFAPLLFQH